MFEQPEALGFGRKYGQYFPLFPVLISYFNFLGEIKSLEAIFTELQNSFFPTYYSPLQRTTPLCNQQSLWEKIKMEY